MVENKENSQRLIKHLIDQSLTEKSIGRDIPPKGEKEVDWEVKSGNMNEEDFLSDISEISEAN